jgi:nucleoside-diphosphate-sugar epimerase
MVYGATPDGDLDETAPRRYFGNNYSDSKLDAENVALEYAKVHRLPVTVLQPTAVYGPFGPVWTVNVLNKLKTGRVILVNGGDGLCNAVHIDDLVSAMLLAGTRDDAVGEAFLISGEQPITWRDFYARHERMLGLSATVNMSAAEIRARYIQNRPKAKSLFKEAWGIVREDSKIRERLSRTAEVEAVKKAARLFLPKPAQQLMRQQITTRKRTEQPPANVKGEQPIHPLSPLEVKFAAAKTRVRIDKAKRILGYQPIFDFESGMSLTEQWARWANLL